MNLVTIADIRDAYRSERLSAPEYLRGHWRQLRESHEETPDPAWISLATEAQLEAQLAALQKRALADCPLYGVPFAIKDNIDAAGWITTAACPEFAYVSECNAQVVNQLLRAGAVLLGKTNLDQFATGLVGTRSPYGAVPNAFSANHVSGGSSSGSASVLARGLVAFALGTDTAGSGRVPAGFNNLIGFKPTPAILSTAGVVPACRTLDCVSVLALTAADAATVHAVLAARDGQSALEPVFNTPEPPRYALVPRPHVGIPRNPWLANDDYRALFEASVAHLDALHCASGTFDFAPFAKIASMLYEGPWTAERYAAVGALIDKRVPGLDPTVAEVIAEGKRYSAVEAFNALYRLKALEAKTRQAWREFDVLMVPTAPMLPTRTEVAAAPIACNSRLGTYTNFVNLLGLCAVAVPFGFTAEGLPFGVTFIAPGGSDWALLDIASRWQASRALPLGARLRELQPADTRIDSAPPGALRLAVVGAHLSGMPLHHQLAARGARLRTVTTTAPCYRLYALSGARPPKPALARSDGGVPISVEVYDVPPETVGSLLAEIPPPLGLGTIELADGTWVKGFICEPRAIEDAREITGYGGWRAYCAAAGAGDA